MLSFYLFIDSIPLIVVWPLQFLLLVGSSRYLDFCYLFWPAPCVVSLLYLLSISLQLLSCSSLLSSVLVEFDFCS